MTDERGPGQPGTWGSDAAPAAGHQANRTTAATVAVALSIAIAGGVVVYAGTSASGTGGPGGRFAPGGGQAGGAGMNGVAGQDPMAGALHGEYVEPDDDGDGYQTTLLQRGKITELTATSITTASEDGYTKTYAIDASTELGTGDGPAPDTGDTVTVTAESRPDHPDRPVARTVTADEPPGRVAGGGDGGNRPARGGN